MRSPWTLLVVNMSNTEFGSFGRNRLRRCILRFSWNSIALFFRTRISTACVHLECHHGNPVVLSKGFQSVQRVRSAACCWIGSFLPAYFEVGQICMTAYSALNNLVKNALFCVSTEPICCYPSRNFHSGWKRLFSTG